MTTGASSVQTELRDVGADPGETTHCVLLAEANHVAQQPPYVRTSRRNHVYESIGFPEGMKYDEKNNAEPLTGVSDAFQASNKGLDFPSYETTIEEAQAHFVYMFQELGLYETFSIPPNTVRELFRRIANSYRDQAYHNFRHALDVAQFCYVAILQSETAKRVLKPLDQLSLLLLSLAHDIDHPGVNNGFLVKTQDPLALFYNDVSVLENAHAAALFLMMQNYQDANVLASLSAEDRKHVRDTVLCGILATDMDRHAALLKTFKGWRPVQEVAPEECGADDVRMLIQCLAKCGDLAHLVRPWRHAKMWEDLVMVEFFEQGDREKALGYDVMALFDRRVCNVPASQVWFYENVGRELFESLARHIPEADEYLKQMNEINIPAWAALIGK